MNTNHVITKEEVKNIYETKTFKLSMSGLYVIPDYMKPSIRSIGDNRNDLENTKDQILKIIRLGKEHNDPIDVILAIILTIPGVAAKLSLEELENFCIDTVVSVFNEVQNQQQNNTVVTNTTNTVVEQPIAARNFAYDASALIRQPQPQQPNINMGQMYNPSFSIAQNTNTAHTNTSHGPNCQCPSCKGSPYWDGMSIQDKAAFVSQHYDILDIHKKNVTEDELNALINLIKNPHTHHSITRLGYTGDISSLKLKEVPPVKYNEYGKGIVNRYFEVPVGNNNIVICYNTHGTPDSNGYMTYNTIIKLDKDLQSNQ